VQCCFSVAKKDARCALRFKITDSAGQEYTWDVVSTSTLQRGQIDV